MSTENTELNNINEQEIQQQQSSRNETLPEDRTCIFQHGQRIYTINFDIVYDPEKGYVHKSATLPLGRWDYGTIVSAIISSKYSYDEIQAIQLNMQCILANIDDAMTEEKKAEYTREYQELSDWRWHAKEIAKTFIESYDYMGPIQK